MKDIKRDRAQLVKTLRAELAMGRSRFGEKFGVTGKTVERWEAGTSMPSADHLELMLALAMVMQAESGAVFPLTKAFHEHVENSGIRVPDWKKEQARSIIVDCRRESYAYGHHQVDQASQSQQIPAGWDIVKRHVEGGAWPFVSDLSRVISLEEYPHPEREAMCNWFGIARLRCGDFEGAEALFHRALAMCTRPWIEKKILTNLGFLRSLQGRLDEGRRFLERALQIDPTHASALYDMFTLESKAQNLDACVRSAHTLLERHPEAAQPGSEIASWMSDDPELAWFKQTADFPRLFPLHCGRAPNSQNEGKTMTTSSPRHLKSTATRLICVLILVSVALGSGNAAAGVTSGVIPSPAVVSFQHLRLDCLLQLRILGILR